MTKLLSCAKHTAIVSIYIAFSACSAAVYANDSQQYVDMYAKDTRTFYVSGRIQDSPLTELMVDTGSSYMTINEDTLAALTKSKQATYVKKVSGVLADGSHIPISIYSIARVEIGANCVISNVEAAVFPGKTRQILGLSALRKTAPFVFSIEPPRLTLSHCMVPTTEDGDRTKLSKTIRTPSKTLKPTKKNGGQTELTAVASP